MLRDQQTGVPAALRGGEIAMVTGAGRGIGRAIAIALANAGMKVALIARSRDQLDETAAIIRKSGGEARSFAIDVTDANAVNAVVSEIESSLGGIVLLVNNAAQAGPIGPFWQTDVHEWWQTMTVNLCGPMVCARAVLVGMILRHRGRVVNIASSTGPIAYFSSYSTSKTALVRFSEIIAAEMKPHGISVFAVGPGTVRTAMSEHSLYSEDGSTWLPWFRRIFDEGLDLPMERPVQLVLELASGRADRLSGRYLTVADDIDSMLSNVNTVENENLYSLRVATLKPATASPHASALASIRVQAERIGGIGLCLERIFNAPPSRVFKLWTDPSDIKKWFVHDAAVHWLRDPTAEAMTGGELAWKLARNGTTHDIFDFHGSYRKVVEHEKLVFGWEWEHLPIEGVSGPGETLVMVDFLQSHAATRMVLTHLGLPNEAAREAHYKGWQRCFDGIEKLLAVGSASG